jgi:hypothetical protein
VATDASGHIAVGGRFLNKADFGGGEVTSQGTSFDSFVTKLDPDGKPLWSRTFSCSRSDQLRGLAIDRTGSVVAAGFFIGTIDLGTGPLPGSKSDFFAMYVVKYAADGTLLWARTFPTLDGGSVYPRRLAVDPDGNILIVGEMGLKADFGGGVLDTGSIDTALILKLSPSGGHLFSKLIGDGRSFRGEAEAVVSTPDRDVVIAGSAIASAGVVDLGGGPMPVPGTGRNPFVLRYTATGSFKSARLLAGDTIYTQGIGIGVYPNGDVLLSGSLTGTLDCGGGGLLQSARSAAYVARYTSGGEPVWCKGFPSAAGLVQAHAVGIDSAGRAVVVGEFSDTVSFGGPTLRAQGGSDLFLFKLAGDGSHLWSRAYGSSEPSDRALDVAVDPRDSTVAVGSFTGTLDVDGTVLTSGQGGAGSGALLLKLTP